MQHNTWDGWRRHGSGFRLLNAIGVEVFGKVKYLLSVCNSTLTIFGLCGDPYPRGHHHSVVWRTA